MEQYIKLYNDFLERTQRNIENLKKKYKIKYYFDLINDIDFFKDLRKKYHGFNIIYTLIQNSNQKKSINFNYMEKDLTISYNQRKYFILILLFPYMIKQLKIGRLLPILRNYIFLSALICRENFNLRNYKVNYK